MGKIRVIAEIEPKGDFPVVSAPNVAVGDTTLTAALNAKANTSDVNTALGNKVDKVSGKGLSTNDYTITEKNKLAGIEAQANKTVISTSVPATPTDETVPSMKLVDDTYARNSSLVSGLATKADASTVSALTERVSTNETDIATQTARIDEIASLPSGSTSGDAELMDIRVKADGTTATNAGSAVREQVTMLNGNIEKTGLKNYFDASNLTDGYIHDGEILGPTSGYHVTDYIPCKYGDEIFVAVVNNTALEAVNLFDENKNYVCSLTAWEGGRVPRNFTVRWNNVRYLRYNVLPYSILAEKDQYIYVRSNNNIDSNNQYTDVLVTSNLTTNSVLMLDGTTNSSQYTNGWDVTDYIPINVDLTANYYVEWASAQKAENDDVAAACCFYDENKNFLYAVFGKTTNWIKGTAKIPKTAKYIRYTLVPSTITWRGYQYLRVFENVNDDTMSDNILKLSGLTNNSVLKDDGTVVQTEYTTGWDVTDYIPIDITPSSYVEWYSAQSGTSAAACCFYDEDKSFLFAAFGGETNWASGKVRVPCEAKYVRYTITPATRAHRYAQYLKLTKMIESTIIVDKKGDSDFMTFKAATEYCWTHPDLTVIVNAGVYDLVEEYGDDYLNNIPSQYDLQHSCGPECGFNCTYIFSSGALLKHHYTGNNPYAVAFFSPINIVGSCTFINANIDAKNCRYCVHEDIPTVLRPVPENVKVIYKDCVMLHRGNDLGTYRQTCAIGAGASPYSVSTIEGGKYTAINGIAAISYHHPTFQDDSECSVNIHNAYIDGVLQTSDYPTDKTGVLKLLVSNCSLSSAIVLGEKTTAETWNNVIRNS